MHAWSFGEAAPARCASARAAESARALASQTGTPRSSAGKSLGSAASSASRRPRWGVLFEPVLLLRKSRPGDAAKSGTRGAPIAFCRSIWLGVLRPLPSSASATERPGGGSGRVRRKSAMNLESVLLWPGYRPIASEVELAAAPGAACTYDDETAYTDKIWLISPSIAPSCICLARASSLTSRLLAWSRRRRSPNDKSLSNFSRDMSRKTLAIS